MSSNNTKGGMEKIPFSYYLPIMGRNGIFPDFSEILTVDRSLVFADMEVFKTPSNMEGMIYFQFDPKCFRVNSEVKNKPFEVNPFPLEKIVSLFSNKDRFEAMSNMLLNRANATYDISKELNGFLFTVNPVVLGLNTFDKEDVAKLSQDFPYSGRFILNDSVKGISFYLSWKKYNDLISERKIRQ